MAMVEFNLNSYVWIKLTDVGEEIYRKWIESLGLDYTPTEADADGWSKWQAWQATQLFGEHMGMGCRLPFGPTIRINSNDATPVVAKLRHAAPPEE